jgi:hypothetical protein
MADRMRVTSLMRLKITTSATAGKEYRDKRIALRLPLHSPARLFGAFSP